MTEQDIPRIAKWPFFIGDLALLVVAGVVVNQTEVPFDFRLMAIVCACVAVGAILCAWPFLAEYKAAVRFAESNRLASTVSQIQNLDAVSKQVAASGAQLHSAVDDANKAVTAAEAIAARMAEESKLFAEFMQRANDSEKATLRLEVDKLRRTEGEWLQLSLRLLDFGFQLNQSLFQAGHLANEETAKDVQRYQAACREAARRVGIVPFIAMPGDGFDPKRHQLMDGATAGECMVVAHTLALGISYQGQLVRQALVELRPADAAATNLPLEEATS